MAEFEESTSGDGKIAILGKGTDGATGVKGTATGAHGTSIGIQGVGQAGAIGVFGSSDRGRGVWGESKSGSGVIGGSLNGNGVSGSSGNDAGVYGDSKLGDGVVGHSHAASGVVGRSDSKYGILGQSQRGIGVHGESGRIAVEGQATSPEGVGGEFTGGRAPIHLAPATTSGAPTKGYYEKGDIYLDSQGTVWVCIISGHSETPDPCRWVRLASVRNDTQGGSVHLVPVGVRLLDASGAPPESGEHAPSYTCVTRNPFAANETYEMVAWQPNSHVPSDAQGLICNVTVLGPSQNGVLSLFPASFPPVPHLPSLTFTAGAHLTNQISVALSSKVIADVNGGMFSIENQSAGDTPLVVDVVGYIL